MKRSTLGADDGTEGDVGWTLTCAEPVPASTANVSSAHVINAATNATVVTTPAGPARRISIVVGIEGETVDELLLSSCCTVIAGTIRLNDRPAIRFASATAASEGPSNWQKQASSPRTMVEPR